MLDYVLHVALLVALPPLLLGVITKVKAFFAGRRGPSLLQPYRDLARLLRKGAVYSKTTTWVFRAGPIVSLATVLLAGLLVPLAGARAPLGFAGDVVVFAYLLGLGRFFTMAAALDTGSSFEGMGASREAAFSALAEPALFVVLATLCLPAREISFARALAALPPGVRWPAHPELLVAAAALFVVMLAECSRIPFDDPNTHLELTMIHEVMVLDHSGPDLAYIEYGAATKLFVLASLIVHLAVPAPLGNPGLAAAVIGGGALVVAAVVGVLESTFARLRLVRVPQFLIASLVLGAIGLSLSLYGGGQP